jgi:flavin-dependent dehydrogenase
MTTMRESRHQFDAILVGARVAGTAAAILLARQGRKILLVDKAAFPSDTISTHIVLSAGAQVLDRLGVLDLLEREGGVRFSRMRTVGPDFDYSADLDSNGVDRRGLCLGRMRMDAAMLRTARSFDSIAVREKFRVTDLLVESEALVGIRGEDETGGHDFYAPLVIGADGMRSTIAGLANARLGAFPRTDVPCARAYYYAYFDGVDRARLGDELITEFESRPGAGCLICRCEDGRTVAAVAFDAAEMREFRTDLGANFRRHLDASLHIGRLLEGATLTGRVRSSGLLLNTYRSPVCNGALLLGDAGLHVDPLFGQGHSFALLSAEIMSELAPGWFASCKGAVIDADTMSEFTRRRDAALMPYYQASLRISRALGLDPANLLAHRAATSERWAADEMVRFAQMLAGGSAFPSFRFARLMARSARAA